MASRKGNGEGTIVEIREDLWRGAITIGRDEDGKLIRKWISGHSRADVAKKMNELIFSINNCYLEPKKVFFSDYLNNWLITFKKCELKPKSYDRLCNVYQNIKDSFLSDVEIGELNANMIQKYLVSLVDNYSHSTIKKNYELINACLKHAVVVDDIRKNPCLGVKIPRSFLEVKKIEILEEDQQDVLINEMLKTYSTGNPIYKYGYAYYLILQTGMRLGELLALTWNDVNLKDRIININKNLVIIKNRSNKDKRKNIPHIQTPKSKSSIRSIYINDKALNALTELKKIMGNISSSNYVLHTCTGKPLSPKSFSSGFSKVCKKLNYVGFSVHSLRHAFASNLFRKGIEIKVVSEILGHADIKTTYNIYIHLFKNVKSEAIKALDTL